MQIWTFWAFVYLQPEKEGVYLDKKDGSTTAACEAKLDAAEVHDEEKLDSAFGRVHGGAN